jgi:carbon-monoxide dehydrogenase large subunit
MERLMDRLARELGLDPVECRQRNLIPADKIPYVKPLKSRAGLPLTIDSGDFPALQARAVEASDRPGFAARRQASESRGRLRGWGMANSVKPTGRGPYESVRLKIQPSGTVAVYTGALAMGQGLKTTLAQLCAPHFGLLPQAIEVLAGDTAMAVLPAARPSWPAMRSVRPPASCVRRYSRWQRRSWGSMPACCN